MQPAGYIIKYIRAFKDNYIWLLMNNTLTKAIAIDPGESASLIDFLDKNNISLEAVWITHHHSDHCGGIDALKEKYSVKIYAPKNDKIEGVDITLDESGFVHPSFASEAFRIIDIPGHTNGHIAYYSSEILFCGDTLFSAGCGRLFEGTAEQMHSSLRKICSLPDKTLIYCAHEYTLKNLSFAQMIEPNNADIKIKIEEVKQLIDNHTPSLPTTLLQEKKINPFLRCHVNDVIHSVESHFNTRLNSEIEVFRCLRTWKDAF